MFRFFTEVKWKTENIISYLNVLIPKIWQIRKCFNGQFPQVYNTYFLRVSEVFAQKYAFCHDQTNITKPCFCIFTKRRHRFFKRMQFFTNNAKKKFREKICRYRNMPLLLLHFQKKNLVHATAKAGTICHNHLDVLMLPW